MRRNIYIITSLMLAAVTQCAAADDAEQIRQAALDYIESQHVPNPAQMERALHPEMRKRTYWRQPDGTMGMIEADKDKMVRLAGRYNVAGDKFPAHPRKDVEILDIDQNVASVKLTADEWIDYLHLMKTDGQWTIVNVLWQFNDTSRHVD